MYARRFLYVLAGLIFLLLAAGLVWSLYQVPLMRLPSVPRFAYQAPPAAGAPDYARPEAWLSRPGAANDPALWLPPGMKAAAPPVLRLFGFRATLIWNAILSSALYAICAAFRPEWPSCTPALA